MSRISRLLAPRERVFFDLFAAAGANVARAGELIHRLLDEWPEQGGLRDALVECEHEGDRITHDIIRRINETFVTPIDREDIHALAGALDDIVDYIEEAADFLGLYRIEAPTAHAQAFGRILDAACTAVAGALPRLRGFQDVHDATVEINRLENEGDQVLRAALASLFEEGIDPMLVIRWKDVYERLEAAVDATERTANILEGILIKNT